VKSNVQWPVRPRKRTNPFLSWSRYIFFIIGILMLGYCGYVLLDTRFFQVYQSWRFQKAIQASQPPASASSAALPPAPLEANPVAAESSAISSREGDALGRLEIRRIGLSAMIMEGVDDKTLRRAVGHFPGTELPGQRGNFVIAGHRDTFFRPLRNIRLDDEIILTTLHGSYRYRVDSTRVTQAEDMSALDNSDDASNMTLVTCYPFEFVGHAPQRFIVRAYRIFDAAKPALPEK
jgi:sortase A